MIHEVRRQDFIDYLQVAILLSLHHEAFNDRFEPFGRH